METLTKEGIVSILVQAGNKRSRSILYADIFLEYTKATSNIDEYGLIVNHPRTGNPIENPYLSLRDKAFRKLCDLKDIKAEELWKI